MSTTRGPTEVADEKCFADPYYLQTAHALLENAETLSETLFLPLDPVAKLIASSSANEYLKKFPDDYQLFLKAADALRYPISLNPKIVARNIIQLLTDYFSTEDLGATWVYPQIAIFQAQTYVRINPNRVYGETPNPITEKSPSPTPNALTKNLLLHERVHPEDHKRQQRLGCLFLSSPGSHNAILRFIREATPLKIKAHEIDETPAPQTPPKPSIPDTESFTPPAEAFRPIR